MSEQPANLHTNLEFVGCHFTVSTTSTVVDGNCRGRVAVTAWSSEGKQLPPYKRMPNLSYSEVVVCQEDLYERHALIVKAIYDHKESYKLYL